jgi:hypothetical protein
VLLHRRLKEASVISGDYEHKYCKHTSTEVLELVCFAPRQLDYALGEVGEFRNVNAEALVADTFACFISNRFDS